MTPCEVLAASSGGQDPQVGNQCLSECVCIRVHMCLYCITLSLIQREQEMKENATHSQGKSKRPLIPLLPNPNTFRTHTHTHTHFPHLCLLFFRYFSM